MPFPVHAGQVYLAVGPAKMHGMLDLAKKLGLYCNPRKSKIRVSRTRTHENQIQPRNLRQLQRPILTNRGKRATHSLTFR